MKTLMPHQQRILDHIVERDNRKWGLFLDMGLGKTLLSLKIAEIMVEKNISNVVLIIPPGLKANWLKEISENTHLNNVEILPYSMLSLGKGVDVLKQIKNDTLVIFDEAHSIKNPKSKRTKNILKILKTIDPYILMLTGTPSPRSILDMWIYCEVLNAWSGNMKLNYFQFSNIYAEWVDIKTSTISFKKQIGEKNREVLMMGLRDKVFFLKKEEVLDLPDKMYETIVYDLSAEQKKLLKNLKNEAISQVEPTQEYILATIHNFLMICSGFCNARYSKDGDKYKEVQVNVLKTNPKLNALKDLLMGNEKKIIIFCTYRKEIELISEMLGSMKESYVVRHGGLNQTDKEDVLEQFKTTDVKYMLATVQSTSTGLNITECDTIIYFNNTHDLTHRLQSEDRIHRIGQTSKCTYIDLVGNNAPDQVLLTNLMNKSVSMDNLFKECLK